LLGASRRYGNIKPVCVEQLTFKSCDKISTEKIWIYPVFYLLVSGCVQTTAM